MVAGASVGSVLPSLGFLVGAWFVVLGGAVAVLWPGASLVCRVSFRELFEDQMRPLLPYFLCLEWV